MRKGFTLVELSIVLVVIGLLIAGVLVGQTLVNSAKTQKAIRELEQYRAATNAYKSKYKCLPGDCTRNMGYKNKSGCYFDWTATGYNNGNGDGLIGTEGNCGYGFYSKETVNYWAFLEQSGMLPAITTRPATSPNTYEGVGILSPSSAIITKKTDGSTNSVGGWWVFSLASNPSGSSPSPTYSYTPPNMGQVNVFFLGNGLRGGSAFPSALRNTDSMAIDQKLDDGLPTSGNIQAVRSTLDPYDSVVSPNSATYGSANCTNTSVSPWAYKTQNLNETMECGLIIKAEF